MICKRLALYTALGGLMAGYAGAALSQSGYPDGGISEITVTAQKREQSLQDVPVAVTAVTEEFMQANRIHNVVDLNAVTPNLNIRVAAAGGSLPTVVLRGVLSYGVAPGQDKQVPIYIDGVYLGNAFGTQFEMADIEQIEVLRGPQGTLFGRNATAGAISITTKRPGGEFDLRQEFTVGNYNQFRSRTRVELPAMGPFKTAFSYTHSEREGEIRNLGAGTRWDFTAAGYGHLTSPKRLGDDDTEAFSATVLFEPENADFSLLYRYDRTDNTNTPLGNAVLAHDVLPQNLGAAAPLLNQLLDDPRNAHPTGVTRRPDAVNNDFSFPGGVESWGHTLTADWNINESWSIKNILAWREASVYGGQSMLGTGGLVNTVPFLGGSATDPQPFVLAGALTGLEFDQFSNEVQVNFDSSFLTATAGLLHYEQDSTQGPPAGVRNIHMLQTYPGYVVPLVPEERPAETSGKSQAGYIQLEAHLSPQLDVVAGYRLTRDEKSSVAFGSTAGGTEDFTHSIGDTNDSYMVGVNYAPADNLLVYGKFSHSFMSGGASYSLTFEPEYVDSWELGVKADLFDRRLRANLALFDAEYDGLQFTTSGAAVGQPNVGIAVANIGSAQARGFELELTAMPLPGLTLGGGLGYTDFGYRSLTPLGVVLTNNGVNPQYRPDWTGNVSAQYDTQPVLFDQAFLRFRVDGNYRSSQWLAPNVSTLDLQKLASTSDIWLLNSRFALVDLPVAGHRLEIALWGRNLTDDDSMAFVNSYGFSVPAMYERARTYGLDVIFNW